jgi:ATP:cob(I)alamin adenosyltransferase
MLYTRKGDNGTTKTFGCDQRISKSSAIAEALGTLDEINSFLGIAKVKAHSAQLEFNSVKIGDMIHEIQKNLFIIQAEVAGADKTISESKVKELENIVDSIEKVLPPIKSFLISGGTELTAVFDFSRTLARRAERRVVQVFEESIVKVGSNTLAYLNRLSSLLYALARYSNWKSGIIEDKPDYK